MRMGCLRWLLPVLALSMTLPASAENRLGIWPGMSADEVATALKPRCPDIAIADQGERIVTCRNGTTVITANVTTKGRTYAIRWIEPSDEEVLSYSQRVAQELGLSGSGKECSFYGYELRCWHAKDGSVLYAGERDSTKRYVSYIVNDKIQEEDDGPQAEAPVAPEQ